MKASESVKQNLGRAVRLMLKPLVKLLIDQGISHQEFSDYAKEVYVEMAARSQLETGGRLNKSRVAIVTGLTRKEVKAVIDRSLKDEIRPQSFSRPGRVLHGWHNDPAYTGPYGIPAQIPYHATGSDPKEPSFVNLVSAYSGDQSPKQMLEELLRVGAIVCTDSDQEIYKVTRRDFEAESLSPKLIERFGTLMYNLMSTVSFNIQKKSVGEGIFDRAVDSNQKLTAEEIERFSQYLKTDKGQAFLEEVDNWLTTTVSNKEGREDPDNHFDSGLAMIHYKVDQPYELEPLKQVLLDSGVGEEYVEETKKNLKRLPETGDLGVVMEGENSSKN